MITRQEALKKIERFENLFINGYYKEEFKDKPLYTDIESIRLQRVIDTYPDMIDKVIPLTIEAIRKSEKYFCLTFNSSSFDENIIKKICSIYKDEVASPDNTPYSLRSIYFSCHSLQQKWPVSVDDTFAIFKDGLRSEKNGGFSLETLYLYGLGSSIDDKPALAKDPELLDLIEKRIEAGQDNDRSLGFCYMLLAEIAKHNPAASEKILGIFSKAVKSPHNDSWAIPRAYYCLKGMLLSNPDLADKIVSCAGNVPTYTQKDDDPHGNHNKTEVVSACGQLFEAIIKTKPSLTKPAYDVMKENLKYIGRFGNGSELDVLENINNYLDTKPKSTKDIAIVLNEMIKNDLKDSKGSSFHSNFEKAILKLQPQHLNIVLEGLFVGAMRTDPNVVAPGERYLKTINEMVKKNPNLSKNVLDGLISTLRVKRMEEKEVQAIEDIFVTIAQNKPKFIDTHIVPILNAAYYRLGYRLFSKNKLKTLAACRDSYNASKKLIMGKTGNEEKAQIPMKAVQAVRAKYQKE